MITDDLTLFQSKRRYPNWQPIASKQPRVNDGNENEAIVKRCLAFLDLEVDVGSWVKQQGNISEEVKEHLLRNSADEHNHDLVLRMLAVHYSADLCPPAPALAIIERWRQAPESPIVKAYALEMGVFFTVLPALMRFGDPYASSVAMWINDDERVHVEVNLRVMRELGLKLTENLVRLVRDTVAYIYPSDPAQAIRACTRLISGKDKEMLTDSLPPTFAFFEQKNKKSFVY